MRATLSDVSEQNGTSLVVVGLAKVDRGSMARNAKSNFLSSVSLPLQESRMQSVKLAQHECNFLITTSRALRVRLLSIVNAIMYSQHFLKWGTISPLSSFFSTPAFRPRARVCCSLVVRPRPPSRPTSLSFQFHLSADRPSIISSARSPHNSCQPGPPAIGIYGCKAGIFFSGT